MTTRRASYLLAIALLLLTSATASGATPESKVTDPVPLLELVAPGGSGRFYTLSVNEAASAATHHGFTLQPRRTGYLRRQAFQGSMPLYRLRANDRPAYLVTPSEAERAALLASGRFQFDGVVGHVRESPVPGT